jgi:putative flippase GtrA
MSPSQRQLPVDGQADGAIGLLRQGRRFVTIGVAQTMLSWAVFVALTALGMSVPLASVLGRLAAANLGFWLNGYYTFSKQRLDWRHAWRFAVVWTLLTILSTVLITIVAARLGLHAAWLAKPLVSAFVACIAFFLWKHAVYR